MSRMSRVRTPHGTILIFLFLTSIGRSTFDVSSGSYSSVGQSVGLINLRSAVRARVGVLFNSRS
jgi:hypothetical protein